MAKKINVAWPVLCKIELDDAMCKLNSVLRRVNYPDDKSIVTIAIKSAISTLNLAMQELDDEYGD